MSSRLDTKPQIWKLASDLGLRPGGSPTQAILKFVKRRVRGIVKKFGCQSLQDLLIATAAEVETVFEEVHSDHDLQQIRAKYIGMGETGFANLEADLRGAEDYAITIRRVKQQEWELPFVSVIDCRGDKVYRTYFSKWHELAHLLTLTPQMRLVFRRSHSRCAARDAEEMLMDVIASDMGFLHDFISGASSMEISFETIRHIKDEYCQDASVLAATIGIVKALPTPCLLLEARPALSKRESDRNLVIDLGFEEEAVRAQLRAVHVTVNTAAREAGIQFHKNWRVPNKSVIARVFEEGGYSEATEDLDWWTTSDGGSLDQCAVVVKAKKTWDSVQALLIPQI
jgi:hypothetical protein